VNRILVAPAKGSEDRLGASLWTQTEQSHTFSYGNHNSAIGIEKARTG
jgi:hypothetical protein